MIKTVCDERAARILKVMGTMVLAAEFVGVNRETFERALAGQTVRASTDAKFAAAVGRLGAQGKERDHDE